MSVSSEQLLAEGWQQLAGPFGSNEEHMIDGFVSDALAHGKDVRIEPIDYATGGQRAGAKMIWQRSKRLAAAA
jgi:hypothetical protein